MAVTEDQLDQAAAALIPALEWIVKVEKALNPVPPRPTTPPVPAPPNGRLLAELEAGYHAREIR